VHAARWFDGLTAESRDVDIALGPEGLTLTPAEGPPRSWPYGELVLMRGGSRGEPVQLERRSAPVEVLVVHDDRFLDRLRAALPAGTRLSRSGGSPITVKVVLALFAAAAALITLCYVWIVPALSRFAADRVPEPWERSFGDNVVAQFVPPEDRVAETAVAGPAVALHARLAASADGRARDSRLVVTRSDVVNAFAVPGGTVVVTTGLLRALRTPEELAAVLAHELGHVDAHHPMRAVARQLSLGALMGLVAGDHSALSGVLRTAGELGGLAYSRNDERAADDRAMALLARSGISPEALARALESLSLAAPNLSSASFLSTHPAPRERLDRLRAAAGALAVRPRGEAIDVAGWRAMKHALEDSTR